MLQNGWFAQFEIRPLKKDFLCKIIIRCIFPNFTSQVVKEICEVSMICQSTQVYLSVFWSWLCPKDLHKTLKGANGTFIQNQYMFSDITWQDFFNGLNNQGNFNEQRHLNICPPEFRNCNKLEEVNTPIFTTDGIFRFDNRYFTNDHFIHSGKIHKIKHCQEL